MAVVVAVVVMSAGREAVVFEGAGAGEMAKGKEEENKTSEGAVACHLGLGSFFSIETKTRPGSLSICSSPLASPSPGFESLLLSQSSSRLPFSTAAVEVLRMGGNCDGGNCEEGNCEEEGGDCEI